MLQIKPKIAQRNSFIDRNIVKKHGDNHQKTRHGPTVFTQVNLLNHAGPQFSSWTILYNICHLIEIYFWQTEYKN